MIAIAQKMRGIQRAREDGVWARSTKAQTASTTGIA